MEFLIGYESNIYIEAQRVMRESLAACLLPKEALSKTLIFTDSDGSERAVKIVEFAKLAIS